MMKAAWKPGQILPGEFTRTTLAYPGQVPGDFVLVSWSCVLPDGVLMFGEISEPNTVRVTMQNGGSYHAFIPPGTLRVEVFDAERD